jgi:tripartite-type tricarboxylate transporter receptor subunit TctC
MKLTAGRLSNHDQLIINSSMWRQDMYRYKHLLFSALTIGMSLSALEASAQTGTWPNKPVTLVVPFAPGGATDNTARSLATALSASLGQSVVVQNVPGGGGSIGATSVAKAPNDGYTFLIGSNSTHGTVPATMKVSYNPVSDFAPVALVGTAPAVLLTSPSSQYKTLAELLTKAKQNPGQISYGSSGTGGIIHMITAMFEDAAGVKMNHIPYKSATTSYVDVIANRVDFVIDYAGVALPYVENGTLRSLAVSSPKRLAALQNTPTFDELGLKGFTADIWVGIFAPAGTSSDIVKRMNEEVQKAVAGPVIAANFAKTATTGGKLSAQEFASVVKNEAQKWPPLVKKNNISLN